MLSENKVKKDEQFCKNMLRKLDISKNLIELPANLKELLIAEDSNNFPENKFILRENESHIVDQTLNIIKASKKLSEMGISYLPTIMLYGVSGGGKTMLARYIAYKSGLPFIYVRFSNLVSSYLGSTQSNITKVFDYAKKSPCVLCFDEIDAIGMQRGQDHDVSEMSRVVIAMMQEMDNLPNATVVIGTTNRYDRLDPALIRRFTMKHEIFPMSADDTINLSAKYFHYADIDCSKWLYDWCLTSFKAEETAATIIGKCTDKIIEIILQESTPA